MSVGFKLRPNTYSRMSHLPAPYKIDTSAVPVIGAPDYIPKYQQRWGKPLDPWLPFDSAPGLHDVEFKYFLENIALKNPGWFEANGFGKADGGTEADYIEFTDAWYGHGAYEAVWAESKRLDGITNPPPVDPPDPPPVDPPHPPIPPPTIPPEKHHFTERMKETANLMESWIPQNQLARRQRLIELRTEILK